MRRLRGGADRKTEVWLYIQAHKDKCALCGIDNPAVLQFHHRDPKEKRFTLGGAARSKSIAQVQAEIAKCVVLCGNCHLLVHAGELDLPEEA